MSIQWKKRTSDAFQYNSCRWLVDFILVVLLSQNVVECLRMTRIEVPSHPVVGESVPLHCIFDLEGDELYSVKWYKEHDEFYRYLPKDQPPAQIYKVAGVDVDLSMSGENIVTLQNLNLLSNGHYRCEVSAEAPSFATVHGEGEMNVIAVPRDIPKITGSRPKYLIGEIVSINCTSFQSKPVAMLTWNINSLKVPREFLREYPITVDRDNLETSILGLTFKVNESHFKDGEMKLKCTATIAPIYHKSNEESVMGGNQQASVLESKETPSHGSKYPVTANRQSNSSSCMRNFTLWWLRWTLVVLIPFCHQFLQQ